MNACREIYERYKASFRGKEDIHTRLMKKYKDIPSWWFHWLLAVTITVSLALCIFLKKEIQMPWWGLLFAAALAFIFTLPVSIITATTNQVIISIITSEIHHANNYTHMHKETRDHYDPLIGSSILLP